MRRTWAIFQTCNFQEALAGLLFISMSDNYRNIGKLVAVFGLQGELVLQHRLGKKTTLKGLKTLFLEERKGEMLPWFVQHVRAKGEEDVYVKFEGIDTKETARRLVQKEVAGGRHRDGGGPPGRGRTPMGRSMAHVGRAPRHERGERRGQQERRCPGSPLQQITRHTGRRS